MSNRTRSLSPWLILACTLVGGCNLDFERRALDVAIIDDAASTATDASASVDSLDDDLVEDVVLDDIDVADMGPPSPCDQCAAGTACCDDTDVCVDLLANPEHCGGCGLRCESGSCSFGVCCSPVFSCETRVCGSSTNDGCGNAVECGTCPAGQECTADGACVDENVWAPRIPDTATRFCVGPDGQPSACSDDPTTPLFGQDGSYVIYPPAYELVDETRVRDLVTGLEWQRQGFPADSQPDQAAQCEASELGGLTDWRLPSYSELYTLVDHGRPDVAHDPAVFSGVRGGVTTTTLGPSGYGTINLETGGGVPQGGGRALCVRGAPLPLERSVTADTIDLDGVGLSFTRSSFRPVGWNAAIGACESLILAGHEDWRLPAAKEMALLYDESEPALVWSELELSRTDDPMLWSATPGALDVELDGVTAIRAFHIDDADTDPVDGGTLSHLCVRNL